VTITANTNLVWWGRQGTSSTGNVYSGGGIPPTAYTENDQVTVSVPSRSATLAASWTDTPVTFEAGYNAQSGVPVISSPYQFTLTQDAYTLTVISVSPNSVLNSAGNVSVNFTSTASSYRVQWHDSNTGGNTVGNVQTFSGSGAKTMPYPSTTVARTLYLYNVTTNTLIPDAVLSQTMPPEYVLDLITMSGTTWTRHCPSGYKAFTSISDFSGSFVRDGYTTDGVNIILGIDPWGYGYFVCPVKYVGSDADGDHFDWIFGLHYGLPTVVSVQEYKNQTLKQMVGDAAIPFVGVCKKM
jgi:hypothetical protein